MQHEAQGQIIRGICSDCPFYDHLGGESQGETVAPTMAGICRRNAPANIQPLDPATVPDTLISGIRPALFPIVRGQDWCGEHPIRAAAYALGVEEMREAIRARERTARSAARKAEAESRTIRR